MAYNKTNWQDTLRDAQGNVIQKGSPLNAQVLGKIEDGIVQTEQKIDAEIGKVTTQLAQTDEKFKTLGTTKRKAELTRGVVTFITDDGNKTDYITFKDIFASAGVPCCTAVVTDNVGTGSRATKEELLELQNDYGWEILSHTKSHARLATLSPAEIESELRLSKEWLLNNNFKTENLAYPYGAYDDKVMEIARKYYRSARSSDFGYSGVNDFPLLTFNLNSLWIDAAVVLPPYNGFQSNTFEYYKYFIDKAVNENRWLIISFHSWGTESDGLLGVFTNTVNYAAQNATVLTMSQALDEVGNIIDVGTSSANRFAVGKDGSTTTPITVASDNRFNGSSKIAEFPQHTTINTVTSAVANSTGLPEGSGVLTTHRNSVKYLGYNWQEYQPYRSFRHYKRYVDDNGEWLTWAEMTQPSTGVSNKFLPAMKISDFQIGITRNTVTVANTSGSPVIEGSRAGTLTTYKYSNTEHGYNWQEWIQFGTGITYTRRVKSDGEWLDWIQTVISTFVPNNFNTPLTPISSFPLGITRNIVQTAHAEGAPVLANGVLTTYKFNTVAHSYNWQEWHRTGSALYYKRSFDNSGNPTAWEPK